MQLPTLALKPEFRENRAIWVLLFEENSCAGMSSWLSFMNKNQPGQSFAEPTMKLSESLVNTVAMACSMTQKPWLLETLRINVKLLSVDYMMHFFKTC